MSGRFRTPQRSWRGPPSSQPSPSNRTLRSLEERINELQHENFRLATRLNELEGGDQPARSGSELAQLREELNDKERLIAKGRESMDAILQRSVQEKKEMAQSYKEEIAALEEHIRRVSTDLSRAKQDYKRLADDRSNERTIFEMKIRDLSSQLQHQHTSSAQHSSLKTEEVSSLAEKLKNRERQLAATEDRLFSAQTTNEDLRSRLQQMEERLRVTNHKLTQSEKTTSSTHASAENQFADLRDELRVMENRAKRAEEQNIHLRSRLDEVTVASEPSRHAAPDKSASQGESDTAAPQTTSTLWKHDAEVELQDTKRELARVRHESELLKKEQRHEAGHSLDASSRRPLSSSSTMHASAREARVNASSASVHIESTVSGDVIERLKRDLESDRRALRDALRHAEDREREARESIATHAQAVQDERAELLKAVDERRFQLEKDFEARKEEAQRDRDRSSRASEQLIIGIQEKLMQEKDRADELGAQVATLEDKLRENAHKMRSTEQTLADKNTTISTQQQRIETLQATLAELTSDCSEKETLLSKAAEKVRSQEAVVQASTKVTGEQATAIHNLHALLETQESVNADLKRKLDDATAAKDALTETIEKLTEQLEELDAHARAEAIERNRIIAEEEARGDAAESRLAKLHDQLKGEAEKGRSSRKEAEELRAALRASQRQVSELMDAVEQAQGDATTAQQALIRIQELEGLNRSLARGLQEAQSESDGAAQRVGKMTESIAQLEAQLTAARDHGDELSRALQDAAREHAHTATALESQLETATKRIGTLEDKLSDKTSEFNHAAAQLRRVEGELGPLKTELARMDELVSSLKTTLSEREADVDVLSADLSQKVDELEVVKTEVHILRQTVRELHSAEQDAERLSGECARLRDDIAQAREEYNSVRSENSLLLKGLDKERTLRKDIEEQMGQDRMASMDERRQLERALSSFQEKTTLLEHDVAKVEAENKKLCTDIEQLVATLEQQEAAYAEKDAEFEHTRALLEQERHHAQQLSATCCDLNGRIADLESTVENARNETKHVSQEYMTTIHKLEDGIAERDRDLIKMDNLSRDKTALETNVLAVQETLNVVTVERDNAQRQLQRANEDISDLESKMRQNDQIISDLRSDLEAQIASNNRVEHEKRTSEYDAKQRESDLLAHVHALEVKCSSENSQKEFALQAQKNLEADTERLQTELINLQAKLGRAAEESNASNTQISTLTAAINDLTRNLRQSDEGKALMRAEADKWERLAKDHEARVRQLHRRIADLEAALEECRLQLASPRYNTTVTTTEVTNIPTAPSSATANSQHRWRFQQDEQRSQKATGSLRGGACDAVLAVEKERGDILERTLQGVNREKSSLRKQLYATEATAERERRANLQAMEGLRQELNRSQRENLDLKDELRVTRDSLRNRN